MIWVWICVGIAVAGVAMVVGYALWLWHKVSDVLAEVGVVTDRLGQLGDLLGQLDLSPLDGPAARPGMGQRDLSGPGRAGPVRFGDDPYAFDDELAAAELDPEYRFDDTDDAGPEFAAARRAAHGSEG